MSGLLARPWTTSRVRFAAADPLLALVIVPEVIVPLVRLGSSAADSELRGCFASDTAGISVQVGVNVHVAVTVRGRVIVGLVKKTGRLPWNLVTLSREPF